MSAVADRFSDLASRMLAKYGENVTLTGPAGAYTVKASMRKVDYSKVAGTRAQTSSAIYRTEAIPAVDITPDFTLLNSRGGLYMVQQADPLIVNGVIVAYDLYVGV